MWFMAMGLYAGAAAAANDAAAGDAAVMGAYPQQEREEYVLACMLVRGESEAMRKSCSCSIDAIARIMPFEHYVQAETVLRMRSLSGPRAALYREAPGLYSVVDEFRTAQAATLDECF
jgi:hypothetical protein